ncbi:acyl carrier protein [Marixanthomonas spongiae]|uniref:Acyl carrier protein n=1 Tax=Marixanthomonas spongiae TaxID=2174845 RepID=A0A2U0I3B1_9FLAO|nr:phosphopantetheine-binding protein [Marixanthomonas spongiae]PVW15596.1 acyl carrier protein [Marixanthomonas spongiae]
MTTEQIYAKLLPIVKTYLPEDVSEEAIAADKDLTGELNINSAHLVDVVLDVEDEFDVEFANADMENLRTLNDAIAIIKQKLNIR